MKSGSSAGEDNKRRFLSVLRGGLFLSAVVFLATKGLAVRAINPFLCGAITHLHGY